MCELTGQKLYQSFAAVVFRGGCSPINTLMPCGCSLFKVTSESAECDTHDAVVGIRTRLQVNRDVSDKLRVWLPRDDVVKTFPIRGPGTVECTRRVPFRDGEECVCRGQACCHPQTAKARFRCYHWAERSSHMPQLFYNPSLLFVYRF